MTSLSVLYQRIKGAILAWLICPCKSPLPPEFVKSSGWRSVVLAWLGPLGWLERATKLAWRTTAETWPVTGITCAEQSRRLLGGMFVLKAQRACWLSQWWHGMWGFQESELVMWTPRSFSKETRSSWALSRVYSWTRGGFLRETVSDLQVLNLMRLCFDQLFRLPRVICRDWQSQIEVTLLYILVSSAYSPTLIFTPDH